MAVHGAGYTPPVEHRSVFVEKSIFPLRTHKYSLSARARALLGRLGVCDWQSAASLPDEPPDWLDDRFRFAVQHAVVSAVDDQV